MVGHLAIRSDEIDALLAVGGPLSLEALAGLTDAAPDVLRRHLEEHPRAVPTPEGTWVSGLGLADGVAFMHELSAIEMTSGMLSADDDLALWAQFAIGGLPLAGGGEVRATTVFDLPPGIDSGLPAGQGAVQALKDYLEGTVDQPFAPLDEIFIELLLTEPETFASPSPSLDVAWIRRELGIGG